MRDIYSQMFKYHHLLPSEVGKQNPTVLFIMLDGLEEKNELDVEHLSPSLKMFYGK